MEAFKDLGDSGYIYQNELDTVCFDTKCILERIKIWLEELFLMKLHDGVFNIAKIRNMMVIKEVLFK